MFLKFSSLQNIETKYDTTQKDAFAVVNYVTKIKKLITRSEYSTKLYIYFSTLEILFTHISNTNEKIVVKLNDR